MLQVRNGDLDKLAILFERYHVGLFNYFLKSQQDQTLCEDLTQNVFERIIKYKNSFNEDSRFKGWIFTIARNVKMDYYRRNKIKTNELDTASEVVVSDHNPREQLEALEDKSRLKQALSLLEKSYSEVLFLTRFQEMKYKDVAVILGCTENTVKSKVHRALNKLRTIYSELN